MVPGASAPNGASAVNAILAALQRGPEAIRLPASPFVLPAAVPGQSPDAAAPASFSRMMMGQLLAAMDRTAVVPTSVLSSVSPHLEGVPTGLAAPPPLTGPVVGPPPGRGSPGTAATAVPLADGGNTPGQQETDQIGTSGGEVRPLAALSASSLTRLTAAARALIRVAPTDPTAVEPLRGAMLRSLDGLEVALPASAGLPDGMTDGAEGIRPLRPLRRVVETAPAAELVSLAQWIVQATPVAAAPVAPEAPRLPAPSPLPQPGQRFQDVLAAVSARTGDDGMPMEPPTTGVAGIPVAARPAVESRAASAVPAAPIIADADPLLPPAAGRTIAVGTPLAPEAAIARSATQAYDAASRYVGRPGLPVPSEPPAMPPAAVLRDALAAAGQPTRAPGVVPAQPGRVVEPLPDPARSAPAAGMRIPAAPASVHAAPVAGPVLPALTGSGRGQPALVASPAAGQPDPGTTAAIQAGAGGPAIASAPVAGQPGVVPSAVPGGLAGTVPVSPQPGSGAPSGPIRVPVSSDAPVADIPAGAAHRSSAAVPAANTTPPLARVQAVAPAVGPESAIRSAAVPAGSTDAVTLMPAPEAPRIAAGIPAIPNPPAAESNSVSVTVGSGTAPAPAVSTVPAGPAVAVATAGPMAAASGTPTQEPTARITSPAGEAGRHQVSPEGIAAAPGTGTASADAVRPATVPARPAGDEGDPTAKPREDAGALFARIHAAASGRPADASTADGASRPAHPALADALERIAAELSRAKPGAPRSLEMNIDAPDLGRVRIRVAMTDAGTVGIELVTPDQRAANALRADLPQLTASLEGRGQVVSGAQVTVAAVGFMAGQDGSGQQKSSHRWFEARGGRRPGDDADEAPLGGAVAAYRRPWAAVDLVA